MILRYPIRSLPALLFATALQAQEGALDPTFGDAGVVLADAGRSDILRDITLQPDGRIVGAGWSYDETHTDLLVARFTSSGELDDTFGDGGVVVLPTGSSYSGAEAVSVLPGGKILVAGYSSSGANNGYTVWRFGVDGTLDATFGSSGTFTDFTHADGSYATDMEVLPDGRIVLTGPAYTGTSCAVGITRLTANGTLDATFGSGGRFEYPPAPTTTWIPSALKLLADGRIVVAGSTALNGEPDPFLVRATAAGQPDATFNGTGARVIDLSNRGYGYNLFVRPDGRYVVTGETLFNSAYDVLFTQVDATGADSNFGGTNIWSANYGTNEYCRGTVVQADGKVLVAGSSMPFGGGANAYLMRTVANGEGIDVSFGTSGWAIGDFGDYTYTEAMLVQPDGKVLIAGNSASGGAPYDMMLARYLMEGTSGVDDPGAADAFALYPIPNDGRCILTGTRAGQRIIVRDLLGRVVHAQAAEQGTTRVAATLPAGTYTVELLGADLRRTLRFIVH